MSRSVQFGSVHEVSPGTFAAEGTVDGQYIYCEAHREGEMWRVDSHGEGSDPPNHFPAPPDGWREAEALFEGLLPSLPRPKSPHYY